MFSSRCSVTANQQSFHCYHARLASLPCLWKGPFQGHHHFLYHVFLGPLLQPGFERHWHVFHYVRQRFKRTFRPVQAPPFDLFIIRFIIVLALWRTLPKSSTSYTDNCFSPRFFLRVFTLCFSAVIQVVPFLPTVLTFSVFFIRFWIPCLFGLRPLP